MSLERALENERPFETMEMFLDFWEIDESAFMPCSAVIIALESADSFFWQNQTSLIGVMFPEMSFFSRRCFASASGTSTTSPEKNGPAQILFRKFSVAYFSRSFFLWEVKWNLFAHESILDS